MKQKNKRNSSGKIWKFFRAGGFDQVSIQTGEDILSLDSLDQKLWVALACPVKGVHFDSRTLSLIDTDNDDRVRVPELLAAIQWTRPLITDPSILTSKEKGLPVSAISNVTEEGKIILDAITKAGLNNTNNSSARITVDEIEILKTRLSEHPFNGDGVITSDSLSSDSEREALNDIIGTIGSVNDCNGKTGVTKEIVEQFFNEARTYCDWHGELQLTDKAIQKPVMIDNAISAIKSIKPKIDDYFLRCRIQTYAQGNISLAVTPLESTTIPLADLKFVSELPLASTVAAKPLPLHSGINPFWADTLNTLYVSAIEPVFGSVDLFTEDQWAHIQNMIAPSVSIRDKKPLTKIESIGYERLKELCDSGIEKGLLDYIEKDKAEEKYRASVLSLEKLVRFQRDLFLLCTNFVNFSHFYANGEEPDAMFLAGNLIIDQRNCRLCIIVNEIGKHSLMAAMAGTYLAYCECSRKGGVEKMFIVAAFTSGDSDNLIVGRNGIFYDRAGNDWDATIVKIIENPISLRQAFWLPYKSFVRMIEANVAKRAAAAESETTGHLQNAAATTVHADKNSIPPTQKKLDIGVVAAIGVAAGAIGTFIATLLGYASGIVKLGPLAVIGAILGLFLLISGPSLILAFIKLRKRNIGPILDASGWAINAKARINVAFGEALTKTATLPAGSQRDLFDPFADKKSMWPAVVTLAVLLYLGWVGLNHFGFVYKWTNGIIGSKGIPTAVVPPAQTGN